MRHAREKNKKEEERGLPHLTKKQAELLNLRKKRACSRALPCCLTDDLQSATTQSSLAPPPLGRASTAAEPCTVATWVSAWPSLSPSSHAQAPRRRLTAEPCPVGSLDASIGSEEERASGCVRGKGCCP